MGSNGNPYAQGRRYKSGKQLKIALEASFGNCQVNLKANKSKHGVGSGGLRETGYKKSSCLGGAVI